jgi:hypothetical protein
LQGKNAATAPENFLGVISDLEFAGATSTVPFRLLNDKRPSGCEAPLVLKGPGIEARSIGDLVQIVVRGAAHVFE